MKRHLFTLLMFGGTLGMLFSCQQYLDVVPDNIATLDNAFTMRSQAEKYLYTCYSYMPRHGDLGNDPAMEGGDEIWRVLANGTANFNIARGLQRIVNPYGDRWGHYYRAIRDCNIFLDNIGGVPDMDETERRRWAAEAMFLKALYHFNLIRMYGPVPIARESRPISTGVNDVRVYRDPVDSGFSYVVQLLDEAAGSLPLTIEDTEAELGRITRPIALAFKAKVLVTAASPLFNGNPDYATLRNPDETPLFSQEVSSEKWAIAAAACREAIEICEQLGYKLYEFSQSIQQYDLSDTILTQLSIRNSVTEKWNSEIIWANTQTSTGGLQQLASTYFSAEHRDNYTLRGELSPPLRIARMFYSDHGVPIEEDKTWGYADMYALQTAGRADRLYVRDGYETVHLHFSREPRFYAALGFDGGIWYGNGELDDKDYSSLYHLEAKRGQRNSGGGTDRSTVTGYFIKKLINYENIASKTSPSYSAVSYPWPVMRLADLYLLYAEALNESQGPGPEVYKYIDLVRQRAGLPSVQTAWSNYAIDPTKHTTINGLRAIIHRERMIELVFEGKRFWDLRRWKTAPEVLNGPIESWNLFQKDAPAYYRPVTIFNQVFGIRDYFWPIAESNIQNNPNLVQNIGW